MFPGPRIPLNRLLRGFALAPLTPLLLIVGWTLYTALRDRSTAGLPRFDQPGDAASLGRWLVGCYEATWIVAAPYMLFLRAIGWNAAFWYVAPPFIGAIALAAVLKWNLLILFIGLLVAIAAATTGLVLWLLVRPDRYR